MNINSLADLLAYTSNQILPKTSVVPPQTSTSPPPIRFLQYWSQTDIPLEVGLSYGLWDSFISQREAGTILRFSRDSALSWLEEYDNELLEVFLSSVHPAIEADIFRVAFACRFPVIWIDSDHVPISGNNNRKFSISEFFDWILCSQGCYLLKDTRTGRPRINNSIFRSNPDCPVITSLRERLIERSDTSIVKAKDISHFAGPQAYTEVVEKLLLSNVTSIHVDEFDMFKCNFGDLKSGVSVGNLYKLLGVRSDYPTLFNGEEWQYKSVRELDWRAFGG